MQCASVSASSPPCLHHHHHHHHHQAVAKFASSMGMSVVDLLTHKGLVDSILSYHFVPGVTLTRGSAASQLTDKPLLLATGALMWRANEATNLLHVLCVIKLAWPNKTPPLCRPPCLASTPQRSWATTWPRSSTPRALR